MSRRLSDDENRYYNDQISMLKGENERLTKYIEDSQRDDLYEKAGKAFWEGHMRGRLFGREAISKEELESCAKWLDALLTGEDHA